MENATWWIFWMRWRKCGVWEEAWWKKKKSFFFSLGQTPPLPQDPRRHPILGFVPQGKRIVVDFMNEFSENVGSWKKLSTKKKKKDHCFSLHRQVTPLSTNKPAPGPRLFPYVTYMRAHFYTNLAKLGVTGKEVGGSKKTFCWYLRLSTRKTTQRHHVIRIFKQGRKGGGDWNGDWPRRWGVILREEKKE